MIRVFEARSHLSTNFLSECITDASRDQISLILMSSLAEEENWRKVGPKVRAIVFYDEG